MTKKPSSRSAPPAPLAIGSGQFSQPGSPVADYSPRSSNEKSYRPFSGDFSYSSMSYHPPNPPNPRKGSSSSSKSSSNSSPSRSSRKPPSPTVNAHSYCGRHSSQWLFSGWSVPDVFRRKDS